MINKIVLKQLQLTNFATFKSQTIEFNSNFNGIIGETGSGKSLVLDALQFILGNRADKRFVRKGCEYSIIEATYETSSEEIKKYFDELGYPFDEEISIKRVLYSTGKSKCFLNLQSCNLQALQNISKRFIDLVGQFENQKLLSPKYQMILLDKFGDTESLRYKFQEKFENYQNQLRKLEELEREEKESTQRLDYLNFQIEEIERLGPTIEDEEDLIEVKNRLLKQEEFTGAKTQMMQLLSESENNIISGLSYVKRILEQFNEMFPQDFGDKCDEAIQNLEDISYRISSIDENEQGRNLEDVISRLDQYQKLKRKFGGSTEAIIDFLNDFKEEVYKIQNHQSIIDEMQSQVNSLKEDCYKIAHDLHNKRLQNSHKLSNKLTKVVRILNMEQAKITFQLRESNILNSLGMTELSLNASLNKGEGEFPIKDIASGGELSRILLALRQVMASKDSISIFLFDEIDTGIGGETAKKIAGVLKDVSENSQVVAITHIPQIAVKADHLILVHKKVKSDRTESVVEHVNGPQVKNHAKQMASLDQ